ncbi:hypothetical protein Y032_0038g3555 [Ancylostoma ceylanicum]|uniref:Peptidase S1 domain-containing protein n=1 Tax=Ancylostoma ceylanicum TaxID=53326 RepID=A0A016UKG1_9BILA|nr:hypothetical protein Y032_0038g3555 [Ancylostoma ceylanicum]
MRLSGSRIHLRKIFDEDRSPRHEILNEKKARPSQGRKRVRLLCDCDATSLYSSSHRPVVPGLQTLNINDIIANWKIEQKIGEGGFGAVYKVSDITSQAHTTYALKTERANAPTKVLKMEVVVLRKAGISKFSVAKGDLVEQDEYPFMATLRYRTADYVQMCGGSLISPYHVLTAAHCVMQFNITKLCNNTSEEKGTDAIYRTSRAVHLGSPNVGDPSKQTRKPNGNLALPSPVTAAIAATRSQPMIIGLTVVSDGGAG